MTQLNLDTIAKLSWPFEEAAKLVRRFEKEAPAKGYCLFETGYGPSGLPHLGTFQEVARTLMVRRAFQEISNIPTKLFCVSDDMDGMRAVPENLPNQAMLTEHLHKPLCDVPDPFGTHESYGAHMNAKLCGFLDQYEFDYEFKSARELYTNGTYDEKLKLAVANYDKIMKVMLPTLGRERQQTYSPFLPISPKTGRVLYLPMKAVDGAAGTVTFDDEDGEELTLPVTGGHVKLQWKPDFGMRWAALGVDFEMYGKDHQANGKLYSAICRILGGQAPEQYVYEMFLDEKGQKISKSKGNGLTIDQWLAYAPRESLSYYIFQSPRKAKRLYFDVIPRAVGDYQTFLAKYAEAAFSSSPLGGEVGRGAELSNSQSSPHPNPLPEGEGTDRYKNPVWHIHRGNPPKPEEGPGFNLLLNLASACNPEDKSVLWGFIEKYMPGASAATHPFLDELAAGAVRYYHDFIKPGKTYRVPTEKEAAALKALSDVLATLDESTSAEDIQTEVYTIGREHEFENMRDWFACMYETLLGAKQGPRMGSFIALYGVANSKALIDKVLAGESLAA